MPRLPINYNNTCFYKIVCRDLDVKELYVGHTTDFNRRKSQHKSACNTESNKDYNTQVYSFIRSNGGWDNFDMILIETKCCETALEARKIERDYVESLTATLNKQVPSRTIGEWRKDSQEQTKKYQLLYRVEHKEEIKYNSKEYYQKNKDTVAQQTKEYREVNKEVISNRQREYRETHRDQIEKHNKEYYENNKETLATYKKDYYEANINQIREYRQSHKEQIAQCNKAYREARKETLYQKYREYYESHEEELARKRKDKIAKDKITIIEQ